MFDLPEHCPIPVNADGQGPADADAVMSVCWCGDPSCMLFYGNRHNRWRTICDGYYEFIGDA